MDVGANQQNVPAYNYHFIISKQNK